MSAFRWRVGHWTGKGSTSESGMYYFNSFDFNYKWNTTALDLFRWMYGAPGPAAGYKSTIAIYVMFLPVFLVRGIMKLHLFIFA